MSCKTWHTGGNQTSEADAIHFLLTWGSGAEWPDEFLLCAVIIDECCVVKLFLHCSTHRVEFVHLPGMNFVDHCLAPHTGMGMHNSHNSVTEDTFDSCAQDQQIAFLST
jgi:hypothetical protein